jgi:hypothetical protein
MRTYLQRIIAGTSESDHRTGAAVDVNANPVTEELDVHSQPDEVRVIVQNATGNFSVDVAFDNTTISVQDGASTDANEQVPVASDQTVTVSISDDSGASNTLDYDLLLV